jgi:hypothetical protein
VKLTWQRRISDPFRQARGGIYQKEIVESGCSWTHIILGTLLKAKINDFQVSNLNKESGQTTNHEVLKELVIVTFYLRAFLLHSPTMEMAVLAGDVALIATHWIAGTGSQRTSEVF